MFIASCFRKVTITFSRPFYTQGGDGLGNAYFFIKRANFLTESVHCFDSFKTWVRVMVKWGNGFFGDFFGVRLISQGKPKKNLQKKIPLIKLL